MANLMVNKLLYISLNFMSVLNNVGSDKYDIHIQIYFYTHAGKINVTGKIYTKFNIKNA